MGIYPPDAVVKTLKYETGGVCVPINALTVIELPPRLFRVRLRGALFDTDKAFLLPGAMAGVRGLVQVYAEHPDMSVVVTGHADRVGAADYNLGLSNERAEAMAMFLRDEAEGWMQWYAWRPYSKAWGIREDQHMLGAVADPSTGLPYYGGPVHGWLDQPTANAVRRFQQVHGLAETGMPNPAMRRALVGEYMGLDGTSLPTEASVELLGCGEHHPEIDTADNVEEQANRRVEVFLFDGSAVEPPVPQRCPGAGCPYTTWREQMEYTIDFDTDLGELVVGVVEHDEDAPDVVPIDGAQVQLVRDGFPTRTLQTPPSGIVRFADVVPGTYTLAAHKEFFETAAEVVEVVAGGSTPPDAADDVRVQGFAPDGGGGSGGPTLFDGVGESAPTGGGNKPRKLPLKGATIIHIVEEIPTNLEDVAKEGAAWPGRTPFSRVCVYPRWETSPPGVHEFAVGADGKTVLAKGDVPKKTGTLTSVKGKGPHLAPLIYTLRDPSSNAIITAPPIHRGKTTEVEISARGRFSIWAFGAPLIKSSWGGIKLDPAQLQAMQAARLDDLTLNYCMAPARGNWSRNASGKLVVHDTKVGFSARLGPGGIVEGPNTTPATRAKNDEVRADYIDTVVEELHKLGIQVLISYTIGTDGGGDSAGTKGFNQDFADWLLAMDDAQIEAHAKAIDDFRERFGADGIGFDFELDELKYEHRDKLQHLIRTTAKYAQLTNAVVTYATAPFTDDGKATDIATLGDKFQALSIQPYALAKMERNIIARPMCFDQTPFPTSAIEASLDYALKPQTQGGVGLDPAQIQFGVFGSGTGRPGYAASEFGVARTKQLCREVFRPRRQGMMVYSLPQNKAGALAELGHAKLWEAELNPAEVGPGTKGQPVQVPRWMDVT